MRLSHIFQNKISPAHFKLQLSCIAHKSCSTATHWITAKHYNTLQPSCIHTRTDMTFPQFRNSTLNATLPHISKCDSPTYLTRVAVLQHTATHCNTLQHTATPCNTLQHTATHCITLQHTATHCNTLQHWCGKVGEIFCVCMQIQHMTVRFVCHNFFQPCACMHMKHSRWVSSILSAYTYKKYTRTQMRKSCIVLCMNGDGGMWWVRLVGSSKL